MEWIHLNNGHTMPLLGTGTNTYGKVDQDYNGELNGDFSPLESALKLGYRLVDTAIVYRNEAGVGASLAQSQVDRQDLFVTTKIPNGESYTQSEESIRQTIDQSLANFATDYIDLYLIHKPSSNPAVTKRIWQVLEDYYDQGKLKNIGVSNFSAQQIEDLKTYAKIMPAVNQIQINLEEKNQDLIDYLQDQKIVPTAWGPMKSSPDQRQALAKIGEKYGKAWSQVLLRYQVQKGIVVIPKSHNPNNQALNLDIFDFDLSPEDMAQVSQL